MGVPRAVAGRLGLVFVFVVFGEFNESFALVLCNELLPCRAPKQSVEHWPVLGVSTGYPCSGGGVADRNAGFPSVDTEGDDYLCFVINVGNQRVHEGASLIESAWGFGEWDFVDVEQFSDFFPVVAAFSRILLSLPL